MKVDLCDLKRAGEMEFRCYFQLAMMVVGGKWKPKILFHLSRHGVVRFGELKRGIFGITEKMLIQSLKELEQDRLIHREAYPVVPPKVEYSLTQIGESIIPILDAMFDWGKSYASFLVMDEKPGNRFPAGTILDDLDQQVTVR